MNRTQELINMGHYDVPRPITDSSVLSSVNFGSNLDSLAERGSIGVIGKRMDYYWDRMVSLFIVVCVLCFVSVCGTLVGVFFTISQNQHQANRLETLKDLTREYKGYRLYDDINAPSLPSYPDLPPKRFPKPLVFKPSVELDQNSTLTPFNWEEQVRQSPEAHEAFRLVQENAHGNID